MFEESHCPKAKWCEFKTTKDNDLVHKEACKHCKREVVYAKHANGRIDNNRYYREHIRDFCQPSGPTAHIFKAIYGEKAVEQFKEMNDQKKKAFLWKEGKHEFFIKEQERMNESNYEDKLKERLLNF